MLPSAGAFAAKAEGDPTLSSQETSRSITASTTAHQSALPWSGVALSLAAFALVVVLVDQVTKALIIEWIGPGQSDDRRELGGSWLALEYVENTGAAFGMFAGRTWLLSLLALAVAIGFLLAFRRDLPTRWPLRMSIGLVLGGGFGNLLDRVRLGYVIDFFAVGIWPRFNIADSAITIGLALLAIVVLRDESIGENGT